MQRIEIPLSRKKLFLAITGSLVFVALGVWMWIDIADRQDKFSPVFVKAVSVCCIVFFLATAVVGIRKAFDKKTGLVIDDEGITDNTSAVSIGLIPWQDITAIQTMRIVSTRFLLISVDNPEQYTRKAKGMKRRLMQANMKRYGTPLSIASTTVKYRFEDLEKLVMERFNRQNRQ